MSFGSWLGLPTYLNLCNILRPCCDSCGKERLRTGLRTVYSWILITAGSEMCRGAPSCIYSYVIEWSVCLYCKLGMSLLFKSAAYHKIVTEKVWNVLRLIGFISFIRFIISLSIKFLYFVFDAAFYKNILIIYYQFKVNIKFHKSASNIYFEIRLNLKLFFTTGYKTFFILNLRKWIYLIIKKKSFQNSYMHMKNEKKKQCLK